MKTRTSNWLVVIVMILVIGGGFIIGGCTTEVEPAEPTVIETVVCTPLTSERPIVFSHHFTIHPNENLK